MLIIVAMLLLGIGGMYGFGFLIYGHVPVTMIQPILIGLAIINVLLLSVTVCDFAFFNQKYCASHFDCYDGVDSYDVVTIR
jgi:hypothetical protein